MTKLAAAVDQPIAGLITDLKSRGMLDDTLVVWTTEFGRTPWGTPASKGREHYNKVFSSWLAGGGIKPGIVYGSSDECGVNVAEDEVHVHDFHATILHCLGFDHTRLTYRHAGRDFRLTDVHGNVVKIPVDLKFESGQTARRAPMKCITMAITARTRSK